MVGWKRIVVTVGEKIGKDHLTYGQGAAAEITAMLTIGAADWFGLAGQYYPRAFVRYRRHHGGESYRAAVGHGTQPGDGLGADTAGLDDAGRVPVLGIPQYLLE